RAAAIVPASVIHSIMRPPWICPGAPACSGNTISIFSTVVSAIVGIEKIRLQGAGNRLLLSRSRAPPQTTGGRAGGLGLEAHRAQARQSRRMQPEPAPLRTRDRPHEPHVQRDPRQFLGQHRLRSVIEASALRSEGNLARADEHVVEPRVSIKGEVQSLWSPTRSLA